MMQKQKIYDCKRVIKGIDKKYRLVEVYRDIALYEEITPSGYPVSQSWILINQHLYIFVASYNNICKEELLDAIDNYKDCDKFGFTGFMKLHGFVVHPNGKDTL